MNLTYKIKLQCFNCKFINEFEMPIISKTGRARHKCDICKEFIIEITAKES